MELWISKWSYGSQNGVMDLKMELWISKWSYGSQNATQEERQMSCCHFYKEWIRNI